MPARLEFLRSQYGEIRDGIDLIERRAADEQRDPTETENAELDALYARATEVGVQITAEADRGRPLVDTAEILARIGAAQQVNGYRATPAVVEIPPVHEYIGQWMRAWDPNNLNAVQDRQEFVQRYRTVAQQITTDNAGIIPVPIVGPITSFIDGMRYMVPSFTQRPMPAAGKTFTRPKITSHASVFTQSAEGAEGASADIQITSDTVAKFTELGTLQISQQNLDWTDPAILQIAVQDFIDVYARRTDFRAATSLAAAASAVTVTYTATDPGTIVQSILNGTKTVYTACCTPADTLWLAVDAAASLAAVVDSNKRPVFTEFGTGRTVANDITFGLSGFLGLNVVVSPDLANGKKIVGCRRYAEWYEDRAGFLRLTTPSTLVTELATYGYIAMYFKNEGFATLQ